MDSQEKLGERIKRLRLDQLKLSQEAFAAKIGVSRVAVTKWETGDTQNMKLANLLALASLCKMSTDELITGRPTTFSKAGISASVSAIPIKPEFDDPVVAEIVTLLKSMDDVGKGMVLQTARTAEMERSRRRKRNAAK